MCPPLLEYLQKVWFSPLASGDAIEGMDIMSPGLTKINFRVSFFHVILKYLLLLAPENHMSVLQGAMLKTN